MTATVKVVGPDPVGRGVARAILASAFPGDAAQHAAGRLLQGRVTMVSLAPPVGREGELRRNTADEAAMRLIGVQSIRVFTGGARHDGETADADRRKPGERFSTYLDGVEEVWLPAIGSDDPHEAAVREVCAASAMRSGCRVVLYAPAGMPAVELAGMVAPLERMVGPCALEQQIVHLDDRALTVKRHIVGRYGHEAPEVDTGVPGAVEHFWRIATSAQG